ncbi:MAG: hypothetical protein VCE43_12975, partial [Myxococcota bacterium]
SSDYWIWDPAIDGMTVVWEELMSEAVSGNFPDYLENNYEIYRATLSPAEPAPEPGSGILGGAALLCLVALRRWRRVL